MSPEQLRSLPLGPKSDLFSLGAVLHEMVTGRPAFDGRSDAELVYRIVVEPPPPMAARRADVPAGLVELVGRLLSIDPAGRPDSAEAAQRALEEIARVERLAASPLTVAATLRELFGDAVSEPGEPVGES